MPHKSSPAPGLGGRLLRQCVWRLSTEALFAHLAVTPVWAWATALPDRLARAGQSQKGLQTRCPNCQVRHASNTVGMAAPSLSMHTQACMQTTRRTGKAPSPMVMSEIGTEGAGKCSTRGHTTQKAQNCSRSSRDHRATRYSRKAMKFWGERTSCAVCTTSTASAVASLAMSERNSPKKRGV